MSLKDVKIIELPKFADPRGNLSFVEQMNHIPFEIKRTYWIYDVPGGEARGGHAFRKNEEFIVALSGAFDVIVDDGKDLLLTVPITGCIFQPVFGGLWRTFPPTLWRWSLAPSIMTGRTMWKTMTNS